MMDESPSGPQSRTDPAKNGHDQMAFDDDFAVRASSLAEHATVMDLDNRQDLVTDSTKAPLSTRSDQVSMTNANKIIL